MIPLFVILLQPIQNIVISVVQNIVTEDVLFWTFGSIVQAFIALLAFLAMIGIYKFQSLERKIKDI